MLAKNIRSRILKSEMKKVPCQNQVGMGIELRLTIASIHPRGINQSERNLLREPPKLHPREPKWALK